MGSLEQSFFFRLLSLLSIHLIIEYSHAYAHSCEPESCGTRDGPLIRFPFRIKGLQHPRCGYPGFDLYCKDNTTFIHFPLLGRDVIVETINYEYQTLTIVADKKCLWNLLFTSSNFTSAGINPDSWTLYTLLNCSKEVRHVKGDPISCLSDAEHHAFIFSDGDEKFSTVDLLPTSCKPIKSISVPRLYPFKLNLLSAPPLTKNNISEKSIYDTYYDEGTDGLSLVWYVPGCIDCERSGNNCGYRDNNSSETLCLLPPHKGRKRWRLWVTIMLPVSFIIILSVFIVCHVQRKIVRREEKNARRELSVLELHANSNGENFSDIGKKGLELPIFSFYNVLAATNNFSVANKLGEGGFGPVYKGKLLNEQEVAMKRLSRNSGQGPKEFKNEILLISKLQHKNLVKLIGICLHGEEKILIYEYMPNKSLDFFLFDPTKREILDWEKRVHIIDGIAQGLLYLHKYSRLTVIHRDLKASNILLDGDMNPKISDFGMARIFSGNESKANTNRVVGTYGYMSPEYAMEGLFSVKSDVFSFGVLLLEIMTGKKNTSFQHFNHSLNLLGYAWELWNEGRGLELIDPILVDSSLATELVRYIHVALSCVQERATDRPTMSEVILFLTNQNADMLSPRQPAFFIGRNAPATSSPSNRPRPCSVNDVTISTMDGR